MSSCKTAYSILYLMLYHLKGGLLPLLRRFSLLMALVMKSLMGNVSSYKCTLLVKASTIIWQIGKGAISLVSGVVDFCFCGLQKMVFVCERWFLSWSTSTHYAAKVFLIPMKSILPAKDGWFYIKNSQSQISPLAVFLYYTSPITRNTYVGSIIVQISNILNSNI